MDEPLDALLRAAREGLAQSGVARAEAYIHGADRGIARFSRGILDQHADLEEQRALVRVAVPDGGAHRLATARTSDVSPAGIARAARRAEQLARVTPAIEGWPGFAPARAGGFERPTSDAIVDAADVRGERVRAALDLCRGRGLHAAGAYESSVHRTAMANTEGLARADRTTFASCKVFALDREGISGFAQQTERDPARIRVEAVAREAADKCAAGRDPVLLPPGRYDVVLEPPAVVELLEWLAFTAFGAREFHDGTSPLSGRLEESVTGERITLVDDAGAEDAFVPAFDRDGTDRTRVVLLERGVARGVAYDRLYGARRGVASTGHAAPISAWDDAPVVQALALEGGEESLGSLVRRVDRGLWISRFHYVNGLIEPRRAVMTGLTRDGTFLIERGERGRGVRNMRFTDAVLEAFARCDGLSREVRAVPTWWSDSGAFRAPAMLIRGLVFTGGGVEPPSA
jgi:PmbA protein